MGRSQGTAKTGGRKKGTPNKRSLEIFDSLNKLGHNPIDELFSLIPQLQPKDQAQVLLGLLPYLYPKRRSVDLTVQEPTPNPIVEMSTEQRRQKLSHYTKLALKMTGASSLLKEGVTIDEFVSTFNGDRRREFRAAEMRSEEDQT